MWFSIRNCTSCATKKINECVSLWFLISNYIYNIEIRDYFHRKWNTSPKIPIAFHCISDDHLHSCKINFYLGRAWYTLIVTIIKADKIDMISTLIHIKYERNHTIHSIIICNRFYIILPTTRGQIFIFHITYKKLLLGQSFPIVERIRQFE